jgi:PBP1b-binding outer membrane lipoprotein LpoB
MIRILLIALLLVGCVDETERSDKYKEDWAEAKPLEMERYIDVSSYYTNKVSTFIMEDHRIIIYHGSYGGRMVAVPLKKKETHKLGSTLYPKSLRLEKR